MNAAVALHEWGACWAAAMGRACWQGGGAIALAWALCRLLPRLPGRYQSWFWRVAYLKLLVAFFWTAPLELPLLTAPPTYPAPAAGLPDLRAKTPAIAAPPSRLSPAADALPSARFDASLGLLLIWLPGSAWCGLQLLRSWRRSRRLRATGDELCDAALLAERRVLCRQMKVRPEPALITTAEIAGPVLVGVGAPAVVLPASFPAQFDRAQLRLMLAHELAHLKRRDLLWAWLPNLGRLLFFFHPLVWLAEREWRLAQEMACDEQVVLATGATPRQYGALLLEVIGQIQRDCRPGLLALGVAGSYATVKRRLGAIQQLRPVSQRRSRAPRLHVAAGLLLLTGAVAGIIPWCLTTRSAAPISPGRRLAAVTVIERAPGSAEQQGPSDLATSGQDRLPPSLSRVNADRFLTLRSAEQRAPGSEAAAGKASSTNAPAPDAAAAHSTAAGRANLAGSAGPYTQNPVIFPPEPRPALATRLREEPSRPLPATVASTPPPAQEGSAAAGDGEAPFGPDSPLKLSANPAGQVGDGSAHTEGVRLNPQKLAMAEEPLGMLRTPKALALPAAFIGWRRSPLVGKLPGLGVRFGGRADPRDFKKMFIALSHGQPIDPRVVKDALASASPEDGRAFKEMLRRIAWNSAPDSGLPVGKPVFLVSKGMAPFDKQIEEKKRRAREAMMADEKRSARDVEKDEKSGAAPDDELLPDF